MKLIETIVYSWENSEIESEYKKLRESYRGLVRISMLNEGVVDDLPDDIIQKVSEIENRMEAIERARNLIKKLQDTGGFTPEQVEQQRKKLKNNVEKLKRNLITTKKQMARLEDRINQILGKKSRY
jgi:uncharacterized protein (DUF3084 family)